MNTREVAELNFEIWPEYGMERADWLEARRHGIGSSDVAPMLGLDRYRSPMSVYLDKTGEGTEVEETEIMRWGRRLEDAVSSEFSERTGKATWRPWAMFQHADHDFALASPDRFVAGELSATVVDDEGDAVMDEEILEVKTGRNSDQWENGPPGYYVVQVVHQMAVCGVDHAHLAVLLNGRDYRQYELARDVELEDILLEREQEFWELVTERIPPAVDGHRATSEALKQLYKRSRLGKAVVLTDEQAGWIDRKKEAAERLKVVKANHEEASNHLRAALGDAEIGIHDGEEVVTWRLSTEGKGRVDLEQLELDHPELVAAYRKPAPTRRLLVK